MYTDVCFVTRGRREKLCTLKRTEIDVAKVAEKKMISYKVQKLSEVITWESGEDTFASIIACYTMAGKERTKTYQEFLLREDEKERWKIVGWRLTDPVEIED